MAYDGSRFYGVQEQKTLPTILGTLRERIEKCAMIKACALVAAARTDRGVHALNNYATFYLKGPLERPIDNIIEEVTRYRGDGLYIIRMNRVSSHVHARASSRGKAYRYTIIDGQEDAASNGCELGFAWKVAPRLDTEKMAQAASVLVGEKDFSSVRGGGCEAGSSIKEIFSINITRCDSGEIVVDIYGRAFLRKMIRNIIGLLVEIGSGLRKPCSTSFILEQKDRNASGIMAPAHGLCLMSVDFELPKSSLL